MSADVSVANSVPKIDITSIRENPVALRTVNREDEDFIGLCDSIRTVGILNPISVRIQSEEVDGKIIEYYELVDGLQRYSAAMDVGLKEIPVNILTMDDALVLEAQIIGNVHRIETRAVEYIKQLTRIFAGNPTLTLTDMAAKIAKSPAWISQRLNLLKLEKSIQTLVNDGKITVSNAVQLAKLPSEEQLNYIDQAMTMGSDEFVPLAQARAKEIRDAARKGREAAPAVFVPLPRCQKMTVLKAEHENPAIGPQLCQKYCKKGEAGFALGVAWVLSLDPASVEIRTAQDVEKKARLADEKKKRAAERSKKKAEEAAKAAAVAAEAAGIKS